jgi:hypothetical protein
VYFDRETDNALCESLLDEHQMFSVALREARNYSVVKSSET